MLVLAALLQSFLNKGLLTREAERESSQGAETSQMKKTDISSAQSFPNT